VNYDVSHVTTYEYGSRVAAARCLLHLEPRNLPGQRVAFASVDIEPRPVEQTTHTDFFGNRTRVLRFAAPHSRLVLRARSRVAVTAPQWPESGETPAWEEVAAAAASIPDLGPESPVHHVFASRHVPHLTAATRYAAVSFPRGRPVLAGLLELTARLHADFAYDPEATEVSTPIATVLETGRGVCQDFAHLMIAGLRGLGLPAAYVSGYLRTNPPPGRERLAGADASHAWARAWCGPALGWVGLDPTNAIPAGEDHLVLAIGRDYSDVAPVSGVLLGPGGQRLRVAVDVVPIVPAQALAG
jgi:transglutaminase-like putative cysteine protease